VHYAADTVVYPPSTCVPAGADPRIKAIVSIDGTSPLMRYHEFARISVVLRQVVIRAAISPTVTTI
jgi:hypothetical protein